MLSALVASAGNKSFVEAARRTVRFPPWERGWKGEGGRGGGKIERRKVASTRLKRWNNGEEGGGRFWVEGKTMGIQEGRVSVFSASMRRREFQGRVLIPWVNCRDTSYFMVSFLGIWFPSKYSEILPVTIVPEIQ